LRIFFQDFPGPGIFKKNPDFQGGMGTLYPRGSHVVAETIKQCICLF